MELDGSRTATVAVLGRRSAGYLPAYVARWETQRKSLLSEPVGTGQVVNWAIVVATLQRFISECPSEKEKPQAPL